MRIEIKNLEEPTRVAKYLAQSGIVSRRRAESLIDAGKLHIDGKLIKEMGVKVTNGQILELNIEDEEASISILLNKPVGYVSAQAQEGELPAIVLVKPKNCIDGTNRDYSSLKIPALGRLDKDSHGLLILSNDGVLAKNIISPMSESEKEYIVQVSGLINEAKLSKLRFGLNLDGRKLKRAKVIQIDENSINFTLNEGRNRQIRRMCSMVGLEVKDLKRVRIGKIRLGNLQTGHWRSLTKAEIESFKPKP